MEKIIEHNWQTDLQDKDIQALNFAKKLTLSPGSMTDEDVEKLRQVGWDDRAILDICQVTAYFNFVNRMAEGLGVQLEKDWI